MGDLNPRKNASEIIWPLLFCRFLGLYMKLDLLPRCPPHRAGPRRWAVQRQKYSLRIYTTAKWTRRWLRYMAIRHAKRAPRAVHRELRTASRLARTSPRCMATGHCAARRRPWCYSSERKLYTICPKGRPQQRRKARDKI